ncbi:MAG: hypothetical protein ACW99G_03630 [Candidatus Thorarchaeota archaeon]|jgi:hypothetical protein
MNKELYALIRCYDKLVALDDCSLPEDHPNSIKGDTLRDIMDGLWYSLSEKELEKFNREIPRRIKMSTVTTNIVSRTPVWSDKPLYWVTEYETFLKLKAIHKWYYQTLGDFAIWLRWKRKTKYRTGTEPKYCTAFINEKEYNQCVNWKMWTPYYSNGCITDFGFVSDYQTARIPFESEEDAASAKMPSKEDIDAFYDKAKAFFEG